MADSDSKTVSNKRPRVDSLPDQPESPQVKRLRESLLDILEDEDADPATQDLATVMKSFEEEIGLSSLYSLPPPSLTSASDSGESQPDLGFLLEASDDELGLPPTFSGDENDKEGADFIPGTSEAVGFGQMWGFEDEIPCYDALDFGVRSEDKNEDESVFFGDLFDYPEAISGPSSDFSDPPWRPESLPAL